jgi:hypothetical protein
MAELSEATTWRALPSRLRLDSLGAAGPDLFVESLDYLPENTVRGYAPTVDQARHSNKLRTEKLKVR